MIQLRSRIRIRLQLFRVTDPAPGPFFGVKKFEFFKKGFKVGSEDDATNKWLILTLSILCVCQQGTKMSKKIQQVFQVCRIRIQNKQLRTRILIQEKVTDPTGSGSATLIIKLKNPSGGYTLTLLLFNFYSRRISFLRTPSLLNSGKIPKTLQVTISVQKVKATGIIEPKRVHDDCHNSLITCH